MNNYELRRKIAELEGWTDIQLGNERSLPDDANLELRGIPPVGAGPWDIRIIHYKIPDWLTDANAAMELVDKMNADKSHQGVSLLYDTESCEWQAIIDAIGWHDCHDHIETDPDIKVAICRLYVAWREAKEAKQ